MTIFAFCCYSYKLVTFQGVIKTFFLNLFSKKKELDLKKILIFHMHRHRLFQATTEVNHSQDESYEKLIEAIRLHQNALKYTYNYLKNSFFIITETYFKTYSYIHVVTTTFSNALIFHITLTTLFTSIIAAMVSTTNTKVQ